ncbi:MAG: hypothetical protein O6931_04410 [Gammaproteobacteria bacterium]|nr:hypothetical protein [Gammaproteobacteria bacterium]
MSDNQITSGIVGSAILALTGATCCALPIALVALGLGSVVASTVSAMPWLGTMAEYKTLTFSLTALILGYSWWRFRSSRECEIGEGRRLRVQQIILWVITAVFGASIFAAYALYPLTLFLDNLG